VDFIGAYSVENLLFLLKGFLVTLEVAFLSIILSFLIGSMLGMLRYTRIPVLSHIVAAIVETIRNLPLLFIIFFTYFALPEVGLQLSISAAAVTALTVFESAMIAEIVRGGLNSVPNGQIEAARSSGLTYTQTLWHIILPQGMKKMIPPLVSQFISLLKDTSLAIVIALPEVLHNAKVIYNGNIQYVAPILLLTAFLYFAVNYVLSFLSIRLERRLDPDDGTVPKSHLQKQPKTA
jgi:putative glutamine transport system permease protein